MKCNEYMSTFRHVRYVIEVLKSKICHFVTDDVKIDRI